MDNRNNRNRMNPMMRNEMEYRSARSGGDGSNSANRISRSRLLRQIMEYDFVQFELNLYLDTHPEDMRALRMHRKAADMAAELRAVYETNFGPITAAQNLSEERWQWIESPWPWDN